MVKGDVKVRRKMRLSTEDKILYTVVHFFIALLIIITAVPLIHIVAASFSNPTAVSRGRVFLWPVDFSLEGYKAVFQYRRVWIGYRNTIMYTVLGTLIELIVTMIAAYPLSRRDLLFKKGYMAFFVFTMFFSGGLIPSYILIINLGWYNTIWPLLIPNCVSVYRIIVARTFIMSTIPHELFESTQIDGCSDARYFVEFVLPLSKAIMAVSALFFAVAHWNSYFSAMLYLQNTDLLPLQLVLRDILINALLDAADMQDAEMASKARAMIDLVKYSLIIVSTVPIMCFYPFVQKYFVKGIMIGSMKG